MENKGSNQIKSIENIIVSNEAQETAVKTIVDESNQQFCGSKHNIYSSVDDEDSGLSTDLPGISKRPNMEGIHARTLTMYEVFQDTSKVLYRATYSKYLENEFYSTWKCGKLQHQTTATCPGSLKVIMIQNMMTVSDIGLHQCRDPSLPVLKWIMEEQASGSSATPKNVYRGKSLQTSSISWANTMRKTVTVKDINISNFPNHNDCAIVYTGKSLDQVETAILQDKYKMQQLCHKVEILYISGNVYDLDPTDATSVLCDKANLNFVYYNDKTYRRYSHSINELGYFNAQYRCHASVDCVAELRLSQDTSDTAYALRFEHHSCRQCGGDDKNDTGIITNLETFYTNLNSKYCYSVPSSGKPLVYFHGYLYEYLHHLCDHHRSSIDKHICLQHKYRCHGSVINNCLAFLLFCNIRGRKHILKVGNHNCKRKLIEIETDDEYKDKYDLIANRSEIQNDISSASGDCKEEIDQCDIKNLLESSIEINQEINCLVADLKENRHDLDNRNNRSDISDSANSCVEDCVEFCATTENSQDMHKPKEKSHDDAEFRESILESLANNTSTQISETKTLETVRDNKKGIDTIESSHTISTIIDLNGSFKTQAIELAHNVKKVLETEEQSHNMSTTIEVNNCSNIEAMEKNLEVDNSNVDTTDNNVRDKIPIISSSNKNLDSQMKLQRVSQNHIKSDIEDSTLLLTIDRETKERKYIRHSTIPVEVKYLGYIFEDLPMVNPKDSSTVYMMYSYNKKSNKILLHYMGYNYYRMRNRNRYGCDTTHLCSAWLNLKSQRLAVFGQHTCRSSINLSSSTTQNHDSENSCEGELDHLDPIPSSSITSLEKSHVSTEIANYQDNDNTLEVTSSLRSTQEVAVFEQHTRKSSNSLSSSAIQIHDSENSCDAVKGELDHLDAIPSSTITSLEKSHVNTEVANYQDNDNKLEVTPLLRSSQEVAVFEQHTRISSNSLSSSATQIHDRENSCSAVAGKLLYSDPIPSSTGDSLEETHINENVANYQDNDNTIKLVPVLKLAQEEAIAFTKNYDVKIEFEKNCEDHPDVVDDICYIKEEPKSEDKVQAFTGILLAEDKQNDIEAADNALDTKICQGYDMTNTSNSVNDKEESKGDVQDYDDTLSNHPNSLIELKAEENIDIMEHCVNRIGTNIETEETSVNISDEEVCCVEEDVAYNTQEIIDITLDDSEEEMVENTSDNLYGAVWNEADTCEVTASPSSNLIIDYDKVLLEYNGYEYQKENSGKFAWCKESKICSGMIKILPNERAEIIGRHTCKGIREIRDGVLEVYDIDQVNNSNEKPVKIRTITSDPRELKPVPVRYQHEYQESASGKSIQYYGYRYKKHAEAGAVSTFLCIHNHSYVCPGMLQMLHGKIVRCCGDHLCNGAKNFFSSAAEDERSNVLIYPNKLTANPEAMYKGYTYQRTLRTSHVSVWQCTASSCSAVIKIYTFTNTLSEVGAHTCLENVRNRNIDKNKSSVGVVKGKGILQKTSKKASLPVFKNKSIIAVFNEKDDINLIYQGNIYRGGGANWSCIHLYLKGCKGFLRILDGDVMHVSKHDCFDESLRSTASLLNKYTNYSDFLSSVPTAINTTDPEEKRTEDLRVFRGSNKKKFALYEGYVYRKFQVSRNGQLCKWICTNHIIHHCEGVLTADNKNTVLATSQHKCRDEDNGIKDRGLFEYYGNYTKRGVSETMVVDTTSTGSTKSNKKDKGTKANKKRKTGLTEETVPTKRFKRYENTRKSEGNKSTSTEEDVETLIPSTVIDLVEENSPGSGDQTTETYKKESGEDVAKYGKEDNREELEYDEVNNQIKLESESQTFSDDVKAVEEKYFRNDYNESSALHCENDDSKLFVLPVKEEFVSTEADCVRILSAIKEENLDADFGDEGAISIVKEEVEEIDSDNVSMALSRGPNGEYFVHVKNAIDTNNPL